MDAYDVGSAGQYSVAPPAAPMLRTRMKNMLRGRTARIRPGVQVHPNHPIFQKVSPAFASFLAKRIQGEHLPVPQMPPPAQDPNGPPPPESTDPTSSTVSRPATTSPPPPNGQVGSTTTDPNAQGVPPWMNIPTDLSGLGAQQWGSGPMVQNPDMSNPRARMQQMLMRRFHTARPQKPFMRDNTMIGHHLRQAMNSRTARVQRPILPPRRSPY